MQVALFILFGAVAVLAAALVFRAIARRKKRRVRKPRARLVHPVVLAHGLFGFDAFEVGGKRVEYWKGIAERIRKAGADCHIAKVPPTASVRERATSLAEQIRAIDAPKVNVIGHSMGGIDARYAISKLGLAGKVASLVTIGTPHLGTPLADVGAAASLPLTRMGFPLDGLHDARGRKMTAFNRRVKDVPGVDYASYIGSARDVNSLLLAGWLYLRASSGDNDGVVPANSQMWGDVLGEIDADHWAQIGWGNGSKFDAPAFYADLIRELRGRGL